MVQFRQSISSNRQFALFVLTIKLSEHQIIAIAITTVAILEILIGYSMLYSKVSQMFINFKLAIINKEILIIKQFISIELVIDIRIERSSWSWLQWAIIEYNQIEQFIEMVNMSTYIAFPANRNNSLIHMIIIKEYMLEYWPLIVIKMMH